MTLSIREKLTKLRELMQQQGIDYYFVPASDDHQNEYVPECWQRRAWVSNFTGSAGDVVIGTTEAFLWTDPRYFLQASQELDSSCFQLMKQGQGETPPIDQWLLTQKDQLKFGFDPRVVTYQAAQRLERAVTAKGGKLIALENNLIDALWNNKPAVPCKPVRIYPDQLAGLTAQQKITQVRQEMQRNHADAVVLTVLDAIAWVFNIRGTDIEFNPLVISYALITADHAFLFVDPTKISAEVATYLKSQQITTLPYEAFANHLQKLTGEIWCDPNTVSVWTTHNLSNAELFLQRSPITLMKACKNPTEQKGTRLAHEYDAVAMIQFLHWLDNNWKNDVTEISAADKLAEFRFANPKCLDLSFTTITGFAEHGAIVHYRVDEQSNKKITDQSLYLLDSGAQYLEGTTDITRTLHLGTPTAVQKHHYTLVLKGHLGIRHLKFPHGTCGEQINAIAHAPLWNEGVDFGHGTGHGVGCYLCVHEGPQAIANRYTNVPLLPGMIVSNEPGLYFTGEYGIRIENLCLITEFMPAEKSKTGHGPFYGLDDLTLVPYCRKLINKDELTAAEIRQVDEYHARIFKTLQDRLPTPELKAWLADATKPL